MIIVTVVRVYFDGNKHGNIKCSIGNEDINFKNLKPVPRIVKNIYYIIIKFTMFTFRVNIAKKVTI
jgi:hypothetical protein